MVEILLSSEEPTLGATAIQHSYECIGFSSFNSLFNIIILLRCIYIFPDVSFLRSEEILQETYFISIYLKMGTARNLRRVLCILTYSEN
jgi:hypothetical protein